MFNSIKNIIIGAMLFVLFSYGIACSISSSRNADALTQKIETKPIESGDEFPRLQSDDPNTLPEPDNESKDFLARNPLSAQDEASLLVGVWRYRFAANGYQCLGEDIYQSNGSYSSQWNCSGVIYWHTGNWYLIKSGALRREIQNYEPKQYLGNPIRMVSGETVYYRFLDRNRLGMAGNIIAYRAQ